MKTTINHIFFAIGFFMLPLAVKSQESTATHEAGSRAKTVFVEIGGPGLVSANYDFRFRETRNAWGMRAGIGHFSIDGDRLTTIPLQINYLLGKDGHYFEMGAGATYYLFGSSSPVNQWNDFRENESQLMGSMAFGYRRQPIAGGFNFRGGLSPVFMQGSFMPYLPYLSFGYSF